ncbi:MAG: hypothetical protein HY920_00525 [Elusimicrobia bacterium]|nr:hypothetical protein [Elusimicrobiota bacterium]
MERKSSTVKYLFLLLTGWMVLMAHPVLALDFGWTTKTPMPAARAEFAIAVVSNKIYVIGGESDSYDVVQTVEEYDPTTDTWTSKADMPTARVALIAGVVGGKIYAIGGYDAGYNVLATVEEYDPGTDTWASKTDMITARSNLSCGVVNNKIYVIGGEDSSYNPFKTVEEYTPAGDTWLAKADMPTARSFLGCEVVNDKIYAMGGYDGNSTFFATVEEYDPGTDIWSTKTDMLKVLAWFGTGVISNKIYVVGGWGDPNSEEYDPAGDSWVAKTGLNNPRTGVRGAIVNNKLYAIGGWKEYLPTALVEEGVLTNSPALAWTGEANYTSDGCDPEIGYSTTTFTFRIKYTDADNEAPNTGYPKLYLLKDSVEISGIPFAMTAVNSADVTYTDGKLYTKDITGLTYGGTYSYYFVVANVNNAISTSIVLSGPIILNHAPTLAWAGTANYTSSGMYPSTGTPLTNYVFTIKYMDLDNDIPQTNYPNVHIKKNGAEITGSPLKMSAVDTTDAIYSDGKLYSVSVSSLTAGTDYKYYFEGYDVFSSTATGSPLTEIAGPSVAASAPDLVITGITNDLATTVSVGDSIPVSFVLKNQGEINVTNEYKVNFYFSATKNINTAYDLGKLSGSDITIPLLTISQSQTSTASIFIPTTIPAGSYYLGIKVDADSAVAELNETNNIYWSTSLKTIITGSAAGNLEQAFCYPSPANLSKGEKIGFAQFTPRAEVKILSSAGYIIKAFQADDNGAIPAWDGTADSGDKLGSGLYIVHAQDENNNIRMFKIVIIK